MKNVQKQVKKFRREFKIKGIPDLSELKDAVRKLNYRVLTYEGSEKILEDLNRLERSKYVPALTCSKNRENYVFYSEKISEKDLPFILAHEIGHIYLNHLKRNDGIYDTPEYKEYEANAFSFVLLKPKKEKNLLVSSVVAVALSISFFLFSHSLLNLMEAVSATQTSYIQHQKEEETVSEYSEHTEPQLKKPSVMQTNTTISANFTPKNEITPSASQNSGAELTEDAQPQAELVTITQTGKKYHKPNCWHLTNRKYLETKLITEAEHQGYKPCLDCY